MSMFPGPGARVDYNEAGEPLGWDYPSEDDPYDPFEEMYDRDVDDEDYDDEEDDT
jgi:hypothetical protein